MAYIGQGLDRFSNVEKLDAITPSTSTGADPYNLTKGGVAFTPSSADTMVISINGVVQYGNFTVSSSTVTFSGALTNADTCDFIYHMGTGLLSTPVDNSVSTVKIVDSSVTNAKLAGSIANDKLSNSAITINGSAVSLGGTVTIGETKPTITSISPSTITNSQTSITITGTNFVNGINVEAVSTTGAIVQADTVTFSSATSFSAAFTITTDGTYFIRVENPDGNAARSSTALLTVSDAPTWTTAAGSLGSMAKGDTANFTVAATSDSTVSYAVTSGALPSGTSLNTSTGAITGTENSSITAETTYNFTITATDAEAQTASRAFSITVTVGINNGGQFN
jgi:hypothetical protein